MSVLLVPHSNHAVAAIPLGFALPFRVAEVGVTLLATFETTAGPLGLRAGG